MRVHIITLRENKVSAFVALRHNYLNKLTFDIFQTQDASYHPNILASLVGVGSYQLRPNANHDIILEIMDTAEQQQQQHQ